MPDPGVPTGPFGGVLAPGDRPALVLVDPAVAYTDPASPLFADVPDAVAAMRELLALARASGLPVVVTRVAYRSGGSQAPVFRRKVPATAVFLDGNPFARVIDGLGPLPGETDLAKQHPSAFFETGLAALLHGLAVDTVLIGGLSTSGCVRATALDAMQHGFVPVVVADAVGDPDRAAHDANLADIARKIGEVWSLDALRQHLSRAAPRS